MKQFFKKVGIYAVATLAVTVFAVPLRASAAATTATKYVALGDSAPAGDGLPLIDDSLEAKACARSSQGYPVLLAGQLGFSLTDLACSGATIDAGILGSQTAHGLTLTAQLDRAFQNGVPQFITLTVGGNDIHWSDFINACYARDCGTWDDTVAAAKLQAQLFTNLRHVMDEINKRSSGHPPRLALVGYYQPLSNNQPACAYTQGLTAYEINWIRAQDYLLNGVLAAVASQYQFAKYVPIDFTGHELCSTTPWVQGLAEPAPYHPNAAGQLAISRAIAAVVAH